MDAIDIGDFNRLEFVKWMCEVRSWIRRGVLHTPKNKFIANAVGAAALGDPQCIVEMVLNVGTGPVSAQNLQLFFMISGGY